MRRPLLGLGLLALVTAPAAAQVPLLDVRVGAHAVMPTSDLGDAYDTGFGVYGRVGAPIGPVKLMATLTWSRLRGITASGTTDLDVITVQAGPHFSLATLDVGVEAGYFSQFQQIGVAPNLSIELLGFDLTASYSKTFSDPKGSWITLGAGYRF